MKEEDYKPLGFLGAIVLLTVGLVLLGQAGINAIQAGEPAQTPETGALLSASAVGLIEFLFGFTSVIVGVLVFLVFRKKKEVFEEE